jgi:5-methylcytosine-specific restriction enzyme subunit McrC
MSLVVYEYDTLLLKEVAGDPRCHVVPKRVFSWLESQCFQGGAQWLSVTKKFGSIGYKFNSYAGVVRAPCGYQIEVLPKVGKVSGDDDARMTLLNMLSCLGEFRHMKVGQASLKTVKMPLFDVFIDSFLSSVELLVRQGLRGGYVEVEEDLRTLRGKLQFSRHLRRNAIRRDRFSVVHDDFRQDRPENRLIHAALLCASEVSRSSNLKRRVRKLVSAFDGIPESVNVDRDIQLISIERDMKRYESPLSWSCLLLRRQSPLTGAGAHEGPSLLFPMEVLFEAYVTRHLSKQLDDKYRLKAQARSKYLTTHEGKNWFQLKPDLLVLNRQRGDPVLVLDAKWKLIDARARDARKKYNLSQSDFYQLFAYGHNYLKASGDIVLIYPKTDSFTEPLSSFYFPDQPDMRMWVLPFCVDGQHVLLPTDAKLRMFFEEAN